MGDVGVPDTGILISRSYFANSWTIGRGSGNWYSLYIMDSSVMNESAYRYAEELLECVDFRRCDLSQAREHHNPKMRSYILIIVVLLMR
jgi:hypothetical protein